MSVATAPVATARPICGAKRHQGDGAPCARPPGWGTSHPGQGRCKFHAGSTPRAAASAHKALVEREARRYLAELGDLAPISDPIGRLMQLAGESDALLDFYRRQAQELTAAQVVTIDNLGQQRIAAVLDAYTRQIDQLEKILTSMAKLNLGERQTRIAEAQALALGRSLDLALAAGGVAGDQKAKVLASLAQELAA